MQTYKKIFLLSAALCAVSSDAALAQNTARAITKSAKNQLPFQVYTSYFESNSSGLKGSNSYLKITKQRDFDKVFGATATGGENHFLSQNAFATKTVIAVIKRGTSIWDYSVQRVQAVSGTLIVRYVATPKSGGGAAFASPLILAVDKKPYRSVVFIENGKWVGDAKMVSTDKTAQVKVYLIALGDNGKIGRKIGCGDSLVPVTRTIAPTATPLKSALYSLLSTPSHHGADTRLHNFWKGHNLRLKSVGVRDGVATIVISGDVFVAGICDQPRIKEQIEATARQFASVKKVRVFMGSRTLAEAIS